MTDKKSKAIQTMRERYLVEYKRVLKKADQIAFFEEIRDMAAAVGASAWEKFANATLCFLRKDMEAALSVFDEAITLDPGFAYPWYGKGNVLDDLKRYDEALAAYEQSIALDAEYAYPWNGKGNVLGMLKRYDEAMVAFEKAIALDPEFATPWNGKGNVLDDLKRYDEALAAYDKAIALGREYAAPWNGKGVVLKNLKRYDEALAAYEKAIAVDPEYGGYHCNLGRLYWEQKRPADAVKAFQRAIALGFEPEWKAVAEFWIERASRMIKSKKAGKSEEESRQEDRSSDPALITELFEAMKNDLDDFREKKTKFKKRMDESVSKLRIVGEGGANDILVVLRDWNSFSPILRRELRDQGGPGPDERLGGGYFLAWKGHGIVIDPGVDFVTQLYRKGLSIADVDTVVVTHCHLDHTSDLESLVDFNYRHNGARGFKPHPRNPNFRQLQFLFCDSALSKYGEYLKTSGCCHTPQQLVRGGNAHAITDFIDVLAIPAEHQDMNGRDYEAIGLVFVLKDEKGAPPVRVGITSDTRWIATLPASFKDCDVVVAHLGTIEVGEGEGKAGEEAEGGDFLKTDLKNHLGTKGCFRLMHGVTPKLFVMGEFGEELVETRFKILEVFNKLKPDETRFVLGGDSNLAIGLGKDLSVCCSHRECAPLWTRIALDDVQPVLGGDYLFQYICPQHALKHELKTGNE